MAKMTKNRSVKIVLGWSIRTEFSPGGGGGAGRGRNLNESIFKSSNAGGVPGGGY